MKLKFTDAFTAPVNVMKTAYYLDGDGNHIAVTTETPKGPLKGFVFVGKRIVGGNDPTEEAFGIDQVAKFKKLDLGDVPTPILEAFGYDNMEVASRALATEPVMPAPVEAHESTTVVSADECRPVQYGPPSVSCLPFALAVVLFVAAVVFFWYLKHSS